MKVLLAAAATVVVTVLALLQMVISLVLALVTALIDLLPYLLALSVAAAVAVALVRHRRGQRPRDRQRTSVDRIVAPGPAVPVPLLPPSAAHSRRALPSLTTRRERTYVVLGADAGFSAARADGYLRVGADYQRISGDRVPVAAALPGRGGRSHTRDSSRRRTRP
ncbi:hypothetical protein [Mycobacteroides abscessus]|uniref:hypothetical protein n=1 Tax=Mycobacteroides abscessus TaxID=36809 RepID=UPI0003865E23|nr:hypothetical protein [Mycobacteroides abscessus]EPZ18798.1 hypothetical protein M879_19525 [Mycobacteroides abscessus V06705]MDO3267823.1 hypothetical protein [Mycobacteroides abscessus subsp. abscessus]